MRTSNLHCACFTLMMLALLAFGCELSNGCKSPDTNSVAVGNPDTNRSGQQKSGQLNGTPAAQQQQIAELADAVRNIKPSDGGSGILVQITGAGLAIVAAIAPFIYRKRREERSIKIAILAEIRRLITVILKHQEIRKNESVPSNADAASAKPVLDIHEPLIPFSHPVYTEHVKNIGVLNDSVALAVEFYGWVDFLNNFQAKQKEYAARKQSKKFERHYDKILTNIRNRFEHAFDDEFKKYGIPKS